MKQKAVPVFALILALALVTLVAAGEMDQFSYLPVVYRPPDTPTPTATSTATATLTATATATATSTLYPTTTSAPPTSTATLYPTTTSAPPTSTATLYPTSTSRPPTATATNSPPGGCSICSYDAYNCSDFSYQSQAQACFNYCWQQVGYDVHRLDGDGNGLACESLP